MPHLPCHNKQGNTSYYGAHHAGVLVKSAVLREGIILFDWLLGVLSGLGLTGIFAGIFIEAIGLPFPGSVLVAMAGILTARGEFRIEMAWLVSLLGYLLGSLTAFRIGSRLEGVLSGNWLHYIRLTPQRLHKARTILERSAPLYVIGGRFLPTIGNITPYVAGLSGMPLIKFLLYDLIHAVIWLSIFLGAGTVLGDNWHRLTDRSWFWWAAGGVGALLLAYVLWDWIALRGKRGG